MYVPNFERQHVRWDLFHAFHIGVTKQGLSATSHWSWPPFVLFEDGQVICTRSRPNPYERGVYDMLGVSLVATGDRFAQGPICPPLFFPSGEQVTKAWLNNHGQQYLLIDREHNHVVRLNDRAYSHPLALTRLTPEAQKQASVWFAAAGNKPLGASIAIRKPFMSLPKEKRQQVEDFVCSARAAMALMEHPSSKLITHTHGYVSWTESKPTQRVALERVLAVRSWEELEEHELKKLFFVGVDRPFEWVDHLVTKG